jgi:hypothetical protein
MHQIIFTLPVVSSYPHRFRVTLGGVALYPCSFNGEPAAAK